MVPALVVVAVGLVVVWWLRRGRRAFVLSVSDGVVSVRSGWLPGAMLQDYQVALKGVRRGDVAGHFEEGGLRVVAGGEIDEFTEQRLRNIARLYPIASFRRSRKPEERALKATGLLALFSFLRSRD